MIGNLAEWTGLSPESAAVMFSHFRSDPLTTCLSPATFGGKPGFRSAVTGFRCCADEAVGSVVVGSKEQPEITER